MLLGWIILGLLFRLLEILVRLLRICAEFMVMAAGFLRLIIWMFIVLIHRFYFKRKTAERLHPV